MRSILRQLKKYESKPEIEIEEPTSIQKYQLQEVTSYDDIARSLDCQLTTIRGAPEGMWSGILYPRALGIAYWLVRTGRKYVPEKVCDSLLEDFIRKANTEEYKKNYIEASTPLVKRLIMMRVLIASFGFGNNKKDNVMARHKATACGFLNVETTIQMEQAQKLIENAYPQSGIEEQILGRIGYILIWKELCTPDDLLLEEASKHIKRGPSYE